MRLSVGGSRNNPGNANLLIGVEKGAGEANTANREIGGPGNFANREIGAPGVWHSRGYLPHFESAEVTQHVTFHLADSLPRAALARIEVELKVIPTEKRDVER